MPSPVKVDWRVPEREWNRFVEHIHAEYGTVEGYVGREVEAAMREWIDWDGGDEVEQLANRLIQAAGRTLSDFSEKKCPDVSNLSNSEGETVRVTCRVHPEVKDEFKRFTKEHSEHSYGVELAQAIYAHRHGGRWQRVEDKLARVVGDAEGLLSEMNDETEESMTTREKKAIRICRELSLSENDDLHRNTLTETIESIAGETVVKDYIPKVLNHLNFEEHPNTSQLFIHESRARGIRAEDEVDADTPAIDRKEYADLTRDEKVQGIQIIAARQSLKSNTVGEVCRLTSKQVARIAFGGIPNQSHVLDLMESAGAADGFKFFKPYDTKKLQVTLSEVIDEEILHTVGIDEGSDESVEEEASREMDAIQHATQVRADGGEDMI